MEILLKVILPVIIGYLLGSFLPAYFVGKFRGVDVTKAGSRNPGIANTANLFGYRFAILVGIYDIFKSPLAIFIALKLGASLPVAFASGFASVLGHIAPFYLHFRGGRGMAASIGIMGYALVLLLIYDMRFAYVFIPITLIVALLFFMRNKWHSANTITLFVLPLFIISVILYYGIRVESIAFLIAGLYSVAQRVEYLLHEKLKDISVEEKRLLSRKWLRPLASIFAVGVLFYKLYTLIILGIVFLTFVIFETLRFSKRNFKAPIPYKGSEEKRISSMVMFLLGAFMTLSFFSPPIGSLAIMFTIFGDFSAWSIGVSIGKFHIFAQKTLEGTIAAFLTNTLIAAIYLKLGLVSIAVFLTGAIVSTLAELAPLEDDNFSVPLLSAITMSLVNSL
ncbi:MAG: glycerol-3-phosphate acyltransferase [Caldisericum sp.]|jgi:glycerol-3-phosphate acyltransferase PlsY|uniref:glycerol-3-phosphate acyltransferase n=1 Tax=Caldisericum sp. TaxID=2499687 RepID=UPI003D13A0F9